MAAFGQQVMGPPPPKLEGSASYQLFMLNIRLAAANQEFDHLLLKPEKYLDEVARASELVQELQSGNDADAIFSAKAKLTAWLSRCCPRLV